MLVLNAAFYRHEMHNKRPPPALCIDVPTYGMRLERTQPPAAFDAYNPERARIAHADLRDDSSDVLRCINVEQYDEILAFVRRELPELERRRPAQNVVLRDSNADQDRWMRIAGVANTGCAREAWWPARSACSRACIPRRNC